MWQFTGSGSINGINARVDMDVYYGSLDGTSLGTVSNLTATPKGLTSVLTWDTVSGADGYQVCKYNSSTGKYTRVDAVTANKITVTLGSGNCGYSVRAYKKKNGKCYFGNYSTVVYTSKTKVEKAKATSTDTTVTLSWNEVYNADGYDIFWLNPTTGKYCYRTTVDGTSCVRENLKPGNDYTFKVRAYFIKDGETVKGVASDAIEISTKPSRAEKPTFVRSNGSDITLSWNAVNGATGYQLAVYDSDTKTYDVQTTIRKATTLKGSVKDLEALSDYRIAVRAYYKSSTGKYYYGRYSPTTLCTNGIGAPKNPLITVYSTTAVMTWDDVAGAISYTVYKITDSGYVKYKTVSGEKCYIALADAEEGTEFVVTSSGEKDDEVIESAYSVVCTSAKVPSTPTAKLVKAKVKGVQLSWSKIADADGYVIYRYDSSKDKYVTAKVVESGSTCNVSVNGLTSGKTYKFRVRAYKLAENGKAWSDKSNLVTAKTETVSGTNYTASASYNKAIRLRWSKVSDADGYRIYRYSTEKKKYITVKTIRGGENTVYTVSGLAFGKNYKFKIRAYKSDSSGTVWSSASEVYTAATKSVSAPVFKGKSSTKSTVTLRWNKVSGADGYRLYKYDSKTKKYVHVKTISGSSKVTYTFTKLKSGTTYYFKIKAFKKDSTGEGYSAISKKIAVKTKTK
jgi:hypothetical protein